MSTHRAPHAAVGSVHGAPTRRGRNPEYQKHVARLEPYERIARMVIARRMLAAWTQQELAERMGTSHSVISRIEGGQHATSVRTLARLADAFETHLVVGFDDAPEDFAIESDTRQLAAVS